jgi:hypothetical protein
LASTLGGSTTVRGFGIICGSEGRDTTVSGTATNGNGRSKWRAPVAFLMVAVVVAGYVLHYVNPGFAPPAELIPFGLLAAGYLFGVDYESIAKRKGDSDG